MIKSYAHKIILLIIYFLIFFSNANAQDILKSRDLSQLKIDQLTASDISNLKSQLNASGMSIDQAEQMAISKGMPVAEAAKLKVKLNAITVNAVSGGQSLAQEPKSAEKSNNSSETVDTYKTGKTLINPLIFGSELYTGTAPNFEPNLKMATPLNYILGPDDHILVSVYGVQEYNGDLLVSAEGTVNIPNVGQIKVGGLTIEVATQKIKTVMANTVYSYLKSGGSKISVTLSKIRSIKITIIGSNRPGTFNVSSLSTVFNALYIAGGPGPYGSFREIELIRNNKIERKIDLYRFLTGGDQTDNVGLKDNDVIRIPAYKTRVTLEGEVKRPGIYELLPNESFDNLLNYSSGYTDEAYRSSVKVVQITDKEKQILDLVADKYKNYKPVSGDIITVSSILKRFKNRVKIAGAVYRPDDYELTEGLRVVDLIKKADGITPDAFTDRVRVIRLNESLEPTYLSFDIKKALSGDTVHNILLKNEDRIIITSIFDLKEKYTVTVQGEVRIPGSIEYLNKITLYDAIIRAGGFTDATSNKVEIARVIKKDTLTESDDRASIIIYSDIVNGAIKETSRNIELLPFDVVTIRRMAGYLKPESVSINGQVQFSGNYSIAKRNERISDLLKRAGGFTPEAYPDGAYLIRVRSLEQKMDAQDALKNFNKFTKDSSHVVDNEIIRENDKIPLNFKEILESPGSMNDLILKAEDLVYIPKYDGQVKVSGEV